LDQNGSDLKVCGHGVLPRISGWFEGPRRF
jgi:hypothetical protein